MAYFVGWSLFLIFFKIYFNFKVAVKYGFIFEISLSFRFQYTDSTSFCDFLLEKKIITGGVLSNEIILLSLQPN